MALSITYTEGVEKSVAPDSDELEELWLGYYRSIFNPARSKDQNDADRDAQEVLEKPTRGGNHRRAHHRQWRAGASHDGRACSDRSSPCHAMLTLKHLTQMSEMEALGVRVNEDGLESGVNHCEDLFAEFSKLFEQGPV